MKEKRQWCKRIAGNFRVQGGDHKGVTMEETFFHEFSTTDYSHYLNIVLEGGRTSVRLREHKQKFTSEYERL
jgi:hypothetical protein